MQTDVDAPPVRDRAVDQVVRALGETVDVQSAIELVRVGERLMNVADSEFIGPGTHRTAVASAAVYAADRLTAGKSLTQADVKESRQRRQSCPRRCTRSVTTQQRFVRRLNDDSRPTTQYRGSSRPTEGPPPSFSRSPLLTHRPPLRARSFVAAHAATTC